MISSLYLYIGCLLILILSGIYLIRNRFLGWCLSVLIQTFLLWQKRKHQKQRSTEVESISIGTIEIRDRCTNILIKNSEVVCVGNSANFTLKTTVTIRHVQLRWHIYNFLLSFGKEKLVNCILEHTTIEQFISRFDGIGLDGGTEESLPVQRGKNPFVVTLLRFVEIKATETSLKMHASHMFLATFRVQTFSVVKLKSIEVEQSLKVSGCFTDICFSLCAIDSEKTHEPALTLVIPCLTIILCSALDFRTIYSFGISSNIGKDVIVNMNFAALRILKTFKDSQDKMKKPNSEVLGKQACIFRSLKVNSFSFKAIANLSDNAQSTINFDTKLSNELMIGFSCDKRGIEVKQESCGKIAVKFSCLLTQVFLQRQDNISEKFFEVSEIEVVAWHSFQRREIKTFDLKLICQDIQLHLFEELLVIFNLCDCMLMEYRVPKLTTNELQNIPSSCVTVDMLCNSISWTMSVCRNNRDMSGIMWKPKFELKRIKPRELILDGSHEISMKLKADALRVCLPFNQNNTILDTKMFQFYHEKSSDRVQVRLKTETIDIRYEHIKSKKQIASLAVDNAVFSYNLNLEMKKLITEFNVAHVVLGISLENILNECLNSDYSLLLSTLEYFRNLQIKFQRGPSIIKDSKRSVEHNLDCKSVQIYVSANLDGKVFISSLSTHASFLDNNLSKTLTLELGNPKLVYNKIQERATAYKAEIIGFKNLILILTTDVKAKVATTKCNFNLGLFAIVFDKEPLDLLIAFLNEIRCRITGLSFSKRKNEAVLKSLQKAITLECAGGFVKINGDKLNEQAIIGIEKLDVLIEQRASSIQNKESLSGTLECTNLDNFLKRTFKWNVSIKKLILNENIICIQDSKFDGKTNNDSRNADVYEDGALRQYTQMSARCRSLDLNVSQTNVQVLQTVVTVVKNFTGKKPEKKKSTSQLNEEYCQFLQSNRFGHFDFGIKKINMLMNLPSVENLDHLSHYNNLIASISDLGALSRDKNHFEFFFSKLKVLSNSPQPLCLLNLPSFCVKLHARFLKTMRADLKISITLNRKYSQEILDDLVLEDSLLLNFQENVIRSIHNQFYVREQSVSDSIPNSNKHGCWGIINKVDLKLSFSAINILLWDNNYANKDGVLVFLEQGNFSLLLHEKRLLMLKVKLNHLLGFLLENRNGNNELEKSNFGDFDLPQKKDFFLEVFLLQILWFSDKNDYSYNTCEKDKTPEVSVQEYLDFKRIHEHFRPQFSVSFTDSNVNGFAQSYIDDLRGLLTMEDKFDCPVTIHSMKLFWSITTRDAVFNIANCLAKFRRKNMNEEKKSPNLNLKPRPDASSNISLIDILQIESDNKSIRHEQTSIYEDKKSTEPSCEEYKLSGQNNSLKAQILDLQINFYDICSKSSVIVATERVSAQITLGDYKCFDLEFSKIAAYISPIDIDVGVKIDWFNSNETDCSLLKQILNDCEVQCTYHTTNTEKDGNINGESLPEGKFSIDIPEIDFHLNRDQFFQLLAVIKHVILAAPPRFKDDSTNVSLFKSERNLNIGANEGNNISTQKKLLFQYVEGEMKKVSLRRCLIKTIKYHIHKGGWKLRLNQGINPNFVGMEDNDFVEFTFSEIEGHHYFFTNGSSKFTIQIQSLQIENLRPGPSSIEFDDPSSVLKPIINTSEKGNTSTKKLRSRSSVTSVVMLLIRAEMAPPVIVNGRKIVVYDVLEISIFPGVYYSINIQLANDLYKILYRFFFFGDLETIGDEASSQELLFGKRKGTTSISEVSSSLSKVNPLNLNSKKHDQAIGDLEDDIEEIIGAGGVKKAKEVCYFKYVRIGNLCLNLSSHGFVVNLKKFELDLPPFVLRNKLYTWKKIARRFEAHLIWYITKSTASTGISKLKSKFLKKKKNKTEEMDEGDITNEHLLFGTYRVHES